jgi:uncharacterized protein (TIGR00106 family)
VIAAFSITPLGAGDSVSDAVAEAVRIVRASGLPNETNAMFTNLEGEWDEVMAVIKQCVDKVAEVAPRVVAASFYVWISVYNLFVVSVFWSFMADVWRR